MSETTSSDPDRAVRHQLRRSWAADCAVLAPDAPEQLREREVDFLLARWTEVHRKYHTVQHLAEVLAAVDELADADEVGPVGARLAHVAGWYHDVFYDPQAAPGSNEHRSAAMARDHLNALGVARGTVDVVEALVTMTTDHDLDRVPARMASWWRTASVFHDADLWILSAAPTRYREYADQVWSEYSLVPTALFAQGRTRILSGLLSREAIYRTQHASAQWEHQARVNVADELDRWRA